MLVRFVSIHFNLPQFFWLSKKLSLCKGEVWYFPCSYWCLHLKHCILKGVWLFGHAVRLRKILQNVRNLKISIFRLQKIKISIFCMQNFKMTAPFLNLINFNYSYPVPCSFRTWLIDKCQQLNSLEISIKPRQLSSQEMPIHAFYVMTFPANLCEPTQSSWIPLRQCSGMNNFLPLPYLKIEWFVQLVCDQFTLL